MLPEFSFPTVMKGIESLCDAASAEHVEDENDQSHDQQQVDQAPANAETEPQQPENQDDSENCVKHDVPFVY